MLTRWSLAALGLPKYPLSCRTPHLCVWRQAARTGRRAPVFLRDRRRASEERGRDEGGRAGGERLLLSVSGVTAADDDRLSLMSLRAKTDLMSLM